MELRGIEVHGYVISIWSITIFVFIGRGFIDVEMIVNLMSIIIIVFIVIIIDLPRLLVSDELEFYVLKHDCIYVTVSIVSNCVEMC